MLILHCSWLNYLITHSISHRAKKHKRLARSYFKYGLDWIREKLLKPYAVLGIVLLPFIQAIDKMEVVCPL